MQGCAHQIIGEHGFRSFCKVETDLHQHRCTIRSADWKQKDGLFVFEITANRFLHGNGTDSGGNDGECRARPYKNNRFCRHSRSQRSIGGWNGCPGKRFVLGRNILLTLNKYDKTIQPLLVPAFFSSSLYGCTALI